MSFKLPKWGGAMVHSDPQLTDNINLLPPMKNVGENWHNVEFYGERAGAMGNGIAGNGKIAACTFNGRKDNLVIYNYDGEHVWNSKRLLNPLATTSTPMIDILSRVIACDNKKILLLAPKNDDYEIQWQRRFPPRVFTKKQGLLFIPFSPNIINNRTIILPTKNGPLYAIDAHNGKILSKIYLGSNGNSKDYYSTINSACVNDKRIYLTTESTKRSNPPNGRLYAVDLDINAEKKDILKESWHFDFEGKSQASPIFIDGSIYFDGYKRESGLSKKLECRIFAIKDDGSVKWEVNYPNRTWYSFSKNPRGGFWYEDLRGKKLVRFSEENGEIKDEILIENYIQEGLLKHKPMSCMTVCHNKKSIMIISAFSVPHNMYVIAIDLDDKSELWKVPITSKYGMNYAGGQFTILNEDKNGAREPRLVFGTYYDGVMAIG